MNVRFELLFLLFIITSYILEFLGNGMLHPGHIISVSSLFDVLRRLNGMFLLLFPPIFNVFLFII